MTEADKEIINILKELFRRKNNELIDPDDILREQIVKWSIYLAVFCVVIKIKGSDQANSLINFI